MKVLYVDKNEIVLKPTKDDEGQMCFVFDIGIIPDKPTPRRLVITKKAGRYTQTWTMSWKKFLNQTCIGDVALIDKSEFVYKSIKN